LANHGAARNRTAEDGRQADRHRDADPDGAAQRRVVVIGEVDGHEARHRGPHATQGDRPQDAPQGEGLDVDARQGLAEVLVQHPEQGEHADGVDDRAGEVEAAATRDVDDLLATADRLATGGLAQPRHEGPVLSDITIGSARSDHRPP
jgi:hypothetical protein